MFGRPARQPYPSLMAIAGGKAFLCTNLGGVAAVDLSRRCLTWITRYDYMPRPVTKYTTTVYRTPSWFTSPTMYGETGGKAYVVCAPTDAGKLFALDASTGRVAWELRSDGSPISWGRSLVGIRDGKVYVAALYDLYAFDLATGREVQHLRVRQSSAGGGVCQLAGRPVIAEDRILWPGYMGRAGGITEIDTETLAVRRTVSLPGSWSGFGFSVFSQGGLLFTVGGNDYSAGNCRVSARYSVRGLLEKIREELARNPEDAALTLRMALITLRTGDAKAGIEALKKAFDLAEQPPVSQSVRDAAARSLVAAWLQEADREIAAGRTASALELVESARVYALTRGQRSDCFSREEIAVSRSGDAAAKAAMYRRLVDDDPDFGVGADPEIPARTYGIVRLAQLLSDRDHAGEAMGLYQELLDAPVRYAVEGISLREIALAGQRDLIKRFGRETYRSLEEEAVLLVKSGKEEDLEKALRCYPLSRAADDALLALARMQLDAHRADEVVAMLQQALEEESDRPRLAELNCLLALAHHAAGERLRARLAALRVLRTWPEGSLSVNGERVPFKDLLEPLTKQQATAEESAAKPRLPGRLGLLWSSPWGAAGFVRIPDQPAPGAEPRLYVGSASRETGNRLAALDPATGQEAWSWQGLVTPTSVHRAPKGLLFVLAQGLMLFSEQGEQLWEVTTFGVPAPVDVRDDMVIYTTRYQDSRTRRQMSRVTALDAASGVNVWESDLEAGSVLWLRQTEFGVVALTSGREIELVLLDLETGKQLKSCPVSNLTSTRRNVPPLVEEGLVHLVDTRGAIQTYDLLTLDAVASLDTRIADPSLWQRTEHGLLVVGATSVAMFDLAEGKAHWTHSLAKGEAIVERLTCGDSLMLATIQADQTQMIEALRLSDGVSRFRSSCAEEDAARLKLKAGAGFDGGAVFIFTDHRKEDERLELWGFHMLVIDNDGAKRYVWEHESEGASVYVQLQAVDGHVVATCDGTTFCFGRKD